MERPDKTGRFDPLIWIHIVVAHQSEKLRPYTVKILPADLHSAMSNLKVVSIEMKVMLFKYISNRV